MKRRRPIDRVAVQGVTNPALKRLARRGGVKRINAAVYDTARRALRDFLRRVVADTVVLTEYASRRTVVLQDVILALKRNGQ